ncbi:unnamed protein product [Coccothraustes coccothraustes]
MPAGPGVGAPLVLEGAKRTPGRRSLSACTAAAATQLGAQHPPELRVPAVPRGPGPGLAAASRRRRCRGPARRRLRAGRALGCGRSAR